MIWSQATGGVRKRSQQKDRVNNIARRLLARGGSRAPLDASYLLAPRRVRRSPEWRRSDAARVRLGQGDYAWVT